MDETRGPRASPLPQFRIRHLDGPKAFNNVSGGSSNATDDSDLEGSPAVFRMRKASYDDLVTQQPNAALKYHDHENDQITVGSSFELAQRLEETPSTAYSSSEYTPGVEDSMQDFHIDNIEDAKMVWRKRIAIEQERRKREVDFEWNEAKYHHDGKLLADVDNSPPVIADEQFKQTLPGPRFLNDCLRKTSQPSYTSVNLPAAKLDGLALNDSLQGSLTSEGAKMAQQAAAAISPSISKVEKLSKDVRPDVASHENRWASYGNMYASFKQPPAHLPSSSTQTGVEPNTSQSNDQPLFALFKAELAKIAQNRPEVNPSQPAISVTTNSLVHRDVATDECQEDLRQGSKTFQPDIARCSLKPLFDEIGDIASHMLEQNYDLARKLAVAGHHIALETGNDTVKTIHGLTGSRIQPLSPVKSNEEAEASRAGFLSWNRGQANPNHSLSCITKCETASSTCPVRNLIKTLAYDIQEQEVPTSLAATIPQRYPSLTGPSSPSTNSKLSQATQTSSEAPKLFDKGSFEADKILAKRYIAYNSVCGPSKKQYLIRWLGHGPEHDVWYDAENLGGCKGLVEQFETAVGSKSCSSVLPSRDELHSIHMRTAGDRMVASPRWEDGRDTEGHRRLHTDEAIPQRNLDDTRCASISAKEEEKTMSLDELPDTPAVIARASSVEDIKDKDTRTRNTQSTLRHRRSWHPSSRATSSYRAASPTAAAERYPAIARFEAAHAGPARVKRNSLPGYAESPTPRDLGVSGTSESRNASQHNDRFLPAKDKSVRFDLTDPWTEKKKAQEQWQAMQQLEGENPGGSPQSSSSKADKKSERYSSPPPPMPQIMTGSVVDGKARLASDPALRRAKSLDFEAQERASDGRLSSLKSSQDTSGSMPLSARRSSPDIKSTQPSNWQGTRPQRRPYESLRGVQRSASARVPSTQARESNPPGIPRSRDQDRPWPLPEPEQRPLNENGAVEASSITPLNDMYDFSALFGANPWDNGHSRTPLRPEYGPSSKPPQISATTFTTSASNDVQRPPVRFSSNPQLSSSPQPTPPRRTSLPSRSRPFAAVPPAVRARGEQIRATVNRLLEMGFSRTEAQTVSESVDGDLHQALDMLHEDRKARQAGFSGIRDEADQEAGRRMPGSF